MEKLGLLKLDLYVALVCFLFPLGWSMSGFPPNIIAACICWAVSLALLLHAFWIYEKAAGLSTITKVILTMLVAVILLLLVWSPVSNEYRREHFFVDSGKFIEALRAQTTPRYIIRIGCAQASEEACVLAGHFLDFFREANWTVEGNSVQRVTLGKPEAGILLLLQGTGTIDPNNPHSGLWVLQSPSLLTVQGAFRNIGISVGQRADSQIPDDVIAIHFGYHAIAQ